MRGIRCEVIRGRSQHPRVDLGSETPYERLVVGSDPSATWRVEAPRVAPLHVELAWHDGAVWVADRTSGGGVRWHGQPIAGWTLVDRAGDLAIGDAVLRLSPLQHVIASGRGGTPDAVTVVGKAAEVPPMARPEEFIETSTAPSWKPDEKPPPESEPSVIAAAELMQGAADASREESSSTARIRRTHPLLDVNPLRVSVLLALFVALATWLLLRDGGDDALPSVPEPARVISTQRNAYIPAEAHISAQPPLAASEGAADEAAAAELVVSNRYTRALPAYEALAERHAKRHAFSDMVRILRLRIAAGCQDGIGPDGEPCEL